MVIKIENLLEKKNKSMYWLAEKTGISYTTIYRLSKNRTELIRFDTLEKICIALDCTPNDILEVEKQKLI